MIFHIGPDLIEHYEEEPVDWRTCPHCGSVLEYVNCGQCEDGYSHHDCGEDCCPCLDPEPNVTCDLCEGNGGWWWCWNTACPGKQDPSIIINMR